MLGESGDGAVRRQDVREHEVEPEREDVEVPEAPTETGEPDPGAVDPSADDLSPWYGDLAEDVGRDVAETGDDLPPDVPGPDGPQPQTAEDADVIPPGAHAEGPEQGTRPSLYVPPLLDEDELRYSGSADGARAKGKDDAPE